MIKVDLITGSLGVGKTTFLIEYAKYLLEQGQKIAILENDFGAVNVDMMLLQELSQQGCDLEMVAGGCDYHCHKRRLKTKLIALGMCGYHRVLVEPSGVFDVEEFFDVLQEDPLERWYKVDNVIALVEPKQELKEEELFFLANQTSCAGRVIVSKVPELTEEIYHQVHTQICKSFQEYGIDRTDISLSGWPGTKQELEQLLHVGHYVETCRQLDGVKEDIFQTIYVMNQGISPNGIQEIIDAVFRDQACGEVKRIKGFCQEQENWWTVNATAEKITLEPIAKGQDVLIFIGKNLQESVIRGYFQ